MSARRRAIELHNDAHELLEQDLKDRLADWRHAREVESFAVALRQQATTAGLPVEPESTVGRWLEWAHRTVEFLNEKAMGEMGELRGPERAYKLHSKFGWDHELTMDDALVTFFTPIDELVREEIEGAARDEHD